MEIAQLSSCQAGYDQLCSKEIIHKDPRELDEGVEYGDPSNVLNLVNQWYMSQSGGGTVYCVQRKYATI